jgi:S-adenosyl-L-methionine hydrolase (adenosine-forming)
VAIITLLTDFGGSDYFAGAMKGVILSINPEATIVDISHEIPPQDIEAAAFNLLSCYRDFPAGTIHVAVVDPGVGSDRRAVVIECAEQLFVGPDNGLFSWICERENEWSATHIMRQEFFRKPVSNTFHGRDIFAPVTARLASGYLPHVFGPPIADVVKLPPLKPSKIDEYTIEGRIIHIDRFGNCVTNFTRETLESRGAATAWRITLKDREIDSFRDYFADSTTDEVFAIIGSAGFIEICVRNGSAAKLLNVQRGQIVRLTGSALPKIRARSM